MPTVLAREYVFAALEAGCSTQLYISVSPSASSALPACLTATNVWMGKNVLKLNEENTEILLIGPKAAREKQHSAIGCLSEQIKINITYYRLF